MTMCDFDDVWALNECRALLHRVPVATHSLYNQIFIDKSQDYEVVIRKLFFVERQIH